MMWLLWQHVPRYLPSCSSFGADLSSWKPCSQCAAHMHCVASRIILLTWVSQFRDAAMVGFSSRMNRFIVLFLGWCVGSCVRRLLRPCHAYQVVRCSS